MQILQIIVLIIILKIYIKKKGKELTIVYKILNVFNIYLFLYYFSNF